MAEKGHLCLMRRLANRPVPHHRETLPSFVSRMAAMNGVGLRDFCVDMGFSIRKLINLDRDALDIVFELAELEEEQLAELVSWTGQKSGEVRMTFRDEIFVSRALRNPVIRGCPVCLRDEALADPERPLGAITMKGDWQLREVSVCVRHAHLLVPLWEQKVLTERYDLTARLPEILSGLQSGNLDQPNVPLSSFDRWLDGRLEDGRDGTWLADQSLYAATTFCRLLGVELERSANAPKRNEVASLRAAQVAGFKVAAKGPEAIAAALDKLAADASGSGDLPQKAFGAVYRELARAHINDEAFDAFRHIVWKRIIAIWPVAAGETILGFTLQERKLHSLATAAREAGVGEFLLDQLLIEAGAFDSSDTRPPARKTFDAGGHAALLVEAQTLVGPLAMQRAMGATKKQFKSLVEGGLLVPRTKISTVKSPWRLQDGLDFVEALIRLAPEVVSDVSKWEPIQQAKKRTRLSVGSIIQAIRNGRLSAARFDGLTGYSSICVPKADIDQLASQITTASPKPSKLPPAVVCSAAAFGRSVGMRENQVFQRLVQGGHTPASHKVVSKNGTERFYVTGKDIEAFHQRFLSQKTLASEYNGFWRTLVEKLISRGVEPFTSDGESFGNLFLRVEVEREFGRK